MQPTGSKVKSKTAWANTLRNETKSEDKKRLHPLRVKKQKQNRRHTCEESLSNAAHQLSSGCHKRRQPGTAAYSKCSLPLLLNFTWTKGTIKMMSWVGGQLKERQTAPAERAVPTVWARTRRWRRTGGHAGAFLRGGRSDGKKSFHWPCVSFTACFLVIM